VRGLKEVTCGIASLFKNRREGISIFLAKKGGRGGVFLFPELL
jgi:hypothetical protein